MDNQEAIESLRENYCCNRSVCELHSVDLCQKEKCEIWMAISALQAQESPKPTAESVQNVQNEDLILRKAAIDAMSETLKRVFPEHRQIAEKCLNVLPSVQPEPHWIPVSERLPVYGKPVLWSNECGSVFTSAITAMNDHSWAIGKRHRSTEVTAWMPLPEPYRAERRTDEADYRKE